MKTYVKKMAALLGTLLLTIAGNAQVTGGLAAGVSSGAVQISNLDTAFRNVIEGNNIYGFEGGLFLKAKMGPFYVRPMALYNFSGGNVGYTLSSGDNPSSTTRFSAHRISVPLLAGFHIIGPLVVEGGPVYNYLINVTDHFGAQTVQVGNSGWGYRAGIGADFGKIMLHISYQGTAFQHAADKATFNEPRMVTFGVAVGLGAYSDYNNNNK